MNGIGKGIFAGLVATIVLSVLMVMKSAMGVMPQLDVIQMLSMMLGVSIALAWVVHFAIGAMYGAFFAVAYRVIPGSNALTKGLVLGTAAWLMMMLLVMPMAGAGLFGMNMGLIAPMMTLVLHLVFGAVLGLVNGNRATAG